MTGAFSKRAAYWLAAVGIVSFGAAVLYAIFGGQVNVPPVSGPTAYSRSAVGHRAFIRLLRELDVPVVVSQNESASKAGEHALLVLLEPMLEGTVEMDGARVARSEHMRKMLAEAQDVLLVLPKWDGTPSDDNPAWLEDSALLPMGDVTAVLSAAEESGDVIRATRAPKWAMGSYSAKPVSSPLQLIRSQSLVPIIATDEGILLGESEWTEGRVWILSDPDLLSNHGLGNGDNAVLAIEIVDALRGERSLIVDETLHGFSRHPSLYKALFEFPLVLPTTTALLAVLLLLWASMTRFGAPKKAAPIIEPGKAFLIHNTGQMLLLGGHTAHALNAYFLATVADVASRLHFVANMDQATIRNRLDQIAKTRNAQISLRELEADVRKTTRDRHGHRALVVANRVYQWKQEMIHGPRNHPSH